MTDFESQLRLIMQSAAGEPPRAIRPEAVRARGRRHQQRLRLAVAAGLAVTVAGAVAIPVALTGGRGRPVTVISGGGTSVIASPSAKLTNGQRVEVIVKGFPAGQKVTLAECPNPTMMPGVPCSSAPTQSVLVTDRTGAASGSLVVEYAPDGFTKVFGEPKCAPQCLLVATSITSSSTPAVSATTPLTFASLPLTPPPTGNTPEPSGFGVAAASFITANQGWVLGSTGCDGCAGVAHTRDGGGTWSYLPAPPTTFWWYSNRPSAVTDIAFANAADGYLFAPGLFATTDGGRTWTDQHLTDVRALAIAGAYVYALTGYNNSGPELLYRSQLGTASWQKVALPRALGPGQGLQIAAAGPNLVLLQIGMSSVGITADQVGRIWVSTDQGADWQPRSMPCTVADGGASVLSVAYGHPRAWLIDCYDNQQSSQEQNTLQHVYGTADGGQTWARLGNPPQHNAPVLLADNGAGHAFLATVGGGDTLSGTLDGGRTWILEIGDGGSFFGWADLGFISPSIGFVVGPTHYATEHLYRTTDGGQTWAPLTISP